MSLLIAPRPLKAKIWPKAADGHYVDPSWCSERLLDFEDFGPPGARIGDFGCGWGTILRNIKLAGFVPVGGDIVDRLKRRELGLEGVEFHQADFLRDHIANVDSVVCNPPFSLIKKFAERAVEVAHHKAALLCPLRRLPAARWLQKLPLRTVWMLTPRPSMPPGAHIEAGGKIGGGEDDYVWLVFERNWSNTPKLRWLHRDGGAKC